MQDWAADHQDEQDILWRLQAYAQHLDRPLESWELDVMLAVQPDDRPSARDDS